MRNCFIHDMLSVHSMGTSGHKQVTKGSYCHAISLFSSLPLLPNLFCSSYIIVVLMSVITEIAAIQKCGSCMYCMHNRTESDCLLSGIVWGVLSIFLYETVITRNRRLWCYHVHAAAKHLLAWYRSELVILLVWHCPAHLSWSSAFHNTCLYHDR